MIQWQQPWSRADTIEQVSHVAIRQELQIEAALSPIAHLESCVAMPSHGIAKEERSAFVGFDAGAEAVAPEAEREREREAALAARAAAEAERER